MKQPRVVVAGSGILSQAVASRLSAAQASDDQQLPPTVTTLADAALLTDAATCDAALAGADALFLELPADPADPDSLAASGRASARLLKSASSSGVSHVIYCTAASPLRILGVSARRLDARAEAEPAWRDSGLGVTCLVLPVFYQDLLHRLRPRLVHGHACLAIPCSSVPFDMMDADDAAEVVARCLLQPSNRCHGRCLPLSAGKVTVQQLADTLSQQLGVHVLDQKITCEQLRSRGDPASVDLANEFEFIQRIDQQLKRSVVEQHLGDRRIASFADWCAGNRDRLLELLK